MSIYRGSYQPQAPATGVVLAESLRAAQDLTATGGQFIGQWWRPVNLTGDGAVDLTEPTGTTVLWGATTYLPDHVDRVAAHVVYAVDREVRGEVDLSVAIDSTSGADVTRVIEEAPDFDGSTWLPGAPEAIYEGVAVAEVPSGSKGTAALVEVRVSTSKLGTSGERFAFGALGITVWGVKNG